MAETELCFVGQLLLPSRNSWAMLLADVDLMCFYRLPVSTLFPNNLVQSRVSLSVENLS